MGKIVKSLIISIGLLLAIPVFAGGTLWVARQTIVGSDSYPIINWVTVTHWYFAWSLYDLGYQPTGPATWHWYNAVGGVDVTLWSTDQNLNYPYFVQESPYGAGLCLSVVNSTGEVIMYYKVAAVPTPSDCSSLDSWYHIYTSADIPSPPVPPLTPITKDINGLTCQTDFIPTLSGAIWYNYWSLPTKVNVDDATIPNLWWVEFWTGWVNWDRDVAVWTPSWTWSIIATWSLTYPWTATGILIDPDSTFGTFWIDSVRNWVKVPYNIFEFFWTENLAFWTSWAFTEILNDGTGLGWTPLSSSGWVSVGVLANSNGWFSSLSVRYLGRYNGIRIGRGSLIAKTSCSINFNICEWSYNWQSLECQSAQSAWGIPFAWCGITGSGSIYWSGSCVPLADGSGMIIPPSPAAGGYVTLDWSWRVVWTVAPAVTAKSFFAGVFDCGIQPNDAWYIVIWKALICPITVFWNFTAKVWDSVSGTQAAVNQLGQVSINALSGATLAGSWSSYTGGNQLIWVWLARDAELSSNRTIKVTMATMLVIFIIFVIVIIIALLKSR